MKNIKSYCVKGVVGFIFASSSLLSYADEVIGRFEVAGYDVQGNTILSEQELKKLLAPYTGKDQAFESVQKAVNMLESEYHKRGYSLVQVELPEQELDNHIVKLKVVETKIGKVTVTGNRFFDEANIRRSMPALQEGTSPDMLEVAANLKLANQNPQKKNTVQLQAENMEGAIDAVVHVTDEKPWTGTVYVDNTGDPQSGLNRITGLYQHANIADLDHILSLQYTTSVAHPSSAKIFGAGYHIPLYSLNDSIDFYANYANVDSGIVTVGGINGMGGIGFAVSGNGTVAGTRYNHNFRKIGNYDSTLSGGFDYKAYRNNISFNGVPLGNDVTVHPISLTYIGNWAVVGTTFNFYVAGYHNIPGGTKGSAEDIDTARLGASAHYNILRYTGIFAHAFAGDWQVRFALNGQITSDLLVPGEQFGVGGANSVRGFYEREIINDEGRVTNLEFYTPNLCKDKAQCRVLAFYDTGYLSRNNPLPGELDTKSVASAGVGFRLNLAPHWAVQTDWAHVINGTTVSPKGSNRAHFKVILAF